MSEDLGTKSLSSYDEDDITTSILQDMANAFRAVLEEEFEQIQHNEIFTNDAGEEWGPPASVEDWASTSAGMKHFAGVSEVYQKRTTFASAADESKAQEYKEFYKPNVRLAARSLIIAMKGAKNRGEANAKSTPMDSSGNPLQIEDQVSEDKDQDAINAYNNKTAAAQKEQGEEDLRKNTGEPAADTVSFKEQCFLTSRMTDIIDYKYKTISKFKKLPYVADTIQTNDMPSNASLMVHADPFHFVNKMLVYPDAIEMFNMASADIAALQPQIRFFKSVFDEEAKIEKNVEIIFDTTFTNPTEIGSTGNAEHTDLMSLLNDSRKRNAGVGIKKFDLSFIGTDPFAAKKDLRAKLVIYAASMDELFKVRGQHKQLPYRYIDLALKTVTTGQKKSFVNASVDDSNMTRAGATTNDVDRLDFTIKAKIGVRPPMTTVAGNWHLMQALQRNSVTVQMTPTTHEFNFNEDGSLQFIINYVPFIHDHYNTSLYDVFGSRNTMKSDARIKIMNKLLTEMCDAEAKEKIRISMISDRKERRAEHMQYFISRLYDKQLVHYLAIPATVIKEFNEKGPAANIKEVFTAPPRDAPNNSNKTKEEIKQEAKLKKEEDKLRNIVLTNSAGNPVSINDNNVAFAYLHDIIDVAMENIEMSLEPNAINEVMASLEPMIKEYKGGSIGGGFGEDAGLKMNKYELMKLKEDMGKTLSDLSDKYHSEHLNYKNFRVILGPVEIVDPNNPLNVRVVSLGDIPVSIRYFQEFITSEVLSKDRSRMPLSTFLQKLIGKMLKSFLNNDTCFGGAVKHKVRLAKLQAHCYNSDRDHDDITKRILSSRRNVLKKAGYGPESSITPDSIDDIPVVDRLYTTDAMQPVLEPVGFGSNELENSSATREQFQYLIFYAARTNAIGKYVGDKADDTKRGCHHYKLGRDRGIVKTIKLVRDKRPMLKEARFEAEGFDGLQQFKEVYNVDVECYANFNVFPGQKIYVDPEGWAPNVDSEFLSRIGGNLNNLTDLGIGGYYDITKVEHTFGPGEFNTSFTAYWTNGIGKGAPPAAGSPAKKKVDKCSVSGGEGLDKSTSLGSSKNDQVNQARANAMTTPPMMTAIMGAIGLDDVDSLIDVFKPNSPPTEQP